MLSRVACLQPWSQLQACCIHHHLAVLVNVLWQLQSHTPSMLASWQSQNKFARRNTEPSPFFVICVPLSFFLIPSVAQTFCSPLLAPPHFLALAAIEAAQHTAMPYTLVCKYATWHMHATTAIHDAHKPCTNAKWVLPAVSGAAQEYLSRIQADTMLSPPLCKSDSKGMTSFLSDIAYGQT